ncbi:WD repeat-containing protein 5 [Drosophila sulfurigaster albostrigata]|uniref:WD repeat-containing protein 5 n=1 Tax=Drosophila sulfurigaster albostrigata TaxID=89887 RepID=UPI002D21B40E|nr:WD repeat-containing protein 5 [Drosophila sulfurigaster albostrigata]
MSAIIKQEASTATVASGAQEAFKQPLPLNESNPNNESKSNKTTITSPGYSLKLTLEGHKCFLSALRFSPTGDWLASASCDRLVKLWDVRTGQTTKSFEGHTMGINDITWSPDGDYLISCSDDKCIRLWDPLSGQCVRTMQGHWKQVFACSMNPQGNLIASSSLDCTVRLWDVRNGKTLKIVPAHMDPITTLDFNRDGSLFVTGSFDGLVRIWDTISGVLQKTLIDEDNSPVGYVKFAPNGRYILAAYLNSQIKLWSFQKPKCLRVYKGHINLNYCISANFSVTAGMWIVSGSEDHSLHIWSLQRKELVQKLEAHSEVVICVDCHPSQNLIATGSLGCKENLKLWQSSESDPTAK